MRNIDRAIYDREAEKQEVIPYFTHDQASFLISYFDDNIDVVRRLLGDDFHGWQNLKSLSGAMIELKQAMTTARTIAIENVHVEYDRAQAEASDTQ